MFWSAAENPLMEPSTDYGSDQRADDVCEALLMFSTGKEAAEAGMSRWSEDSVEDTCLNPAGKTHQEPKKEHISGLKRKKKLHVYM